MAEACDHTVGYITSHYSPDEGLGSTFDLAMDLARDDSFVRFMAHHEMAKDMRLELSRLATGLRTRMQLIEGE